MKKTDTKQVLNNSVFFNYMSPSLCLPAGVSAKTEFTKLLLGLWWLPSLNVLEASMHRGCPV